MKWLRVNIISAKHSFSIPEKKENIYNEVILENMEKTFLTFWIGRKTVIYRKKHAIIKREKFKSEKLLDLKIWKEIKYYQGEVMCLSEEKSNVGWITNLAMYVCMYGECNYHNWIEG